MKQDLDSRIFMYSSIGHEKFVELLLKNGANVSSIQNSHFALESKC